MDNWWIDDNGKLWHKHKRLWVEVRQYKYERNSPYAAESHTYIYTPYTCECGEAAPLNIKGYHRLVNLGRKL